MTSKNWDIFLVTHLFLIFVNKDFFQEYIEMEKQNIEIKNSFHNIRRIFRMVKLKYSNNIFKTGLYYVQVSSAYIISNKEL